MSLQAQVLPQNPAIGEAVFIGGYPKSGTTLLASLLDGHPDLLVYPEETKFIRLAASGRPLTIDELLAPGNGGHLSGTEVAPSGEHDYSSIDFEEFSAAARRFAQEAVGPAATLEALMKAYAASRGETGRRYWVEKTPQNEFHLREIHQWWPNAKFILMVRDPREAFASHRSYQKKRRNPRVITASKVSREWGQGIRQALCRKAPDKALLIVRYEDLTSNPQETTQQVCAFLGISWSESLLQPSRLGKPWSGNASGGQNFNRVAPSTSKFLEGLTPAEILFLEINLHPLMTRLGYQPHYAWSRWLRPLRRFINLSALQSNGLPD